MLRIKSSIYLTGQANTNDQIPKSKQCLVPDSLSEKVDKARSCHYIAAYC